MPWFRLPQTANILLRNIPNMLLLLSASVLIVMKAARIMSLCNVGVSLGVNVASGCGNGNVKC